MDDRFAEDLHAIMERSDDGAALEQVIGAEDRAISVISVSELLHRVVRSPAGERPRRRAFVEHVLAALEPVPITEPVARVHADVWAEP